MGNGQKKYILVAVQNHPGNSAHEGHYVANAMDWNTGVWFEFNDEDVDVLSDGPFYWMMVNYVAKFLKQGPNSSSSCHMLYHNDLFIYLYSLHQTMLICVLII